jgi:hypothetical protein
MGARGKNELAQSVYQLVGAIGLDSTASIYRLWPYFNGVLLDRRRSRQFWHVENAVRTPQMQSSICRE